MPSWDQLDPFAKAMVWLGAIAGLLWGGTLGDTADALWVGLLGGWILGAIAGWAVSEMLNAAMRVLVLLIEVALIALRILSFLNGLSS